MSLVLHAHPLSSFCHKVLIALYEAGTPFEFRLFNPGDPESRASHLAMWPPGQMPVLQDTARGKTVPETTIIIEYLDRFYPGERAMLPSDPDARLDARLWDRFSDFHVMLPLQRAVASRIAGDAVQEAKVFAEVQAKLAVSYGVLDRHLADRRWLAGSDFSLADCAAEPALFYAAAIVPFERDYPALGAYFDRLLERPSVQRVLKEAGPWIRYFPLLATLPPRYRAATGG
ncbi:glutathione S-transferase family protein [Arenimonas sp.]|uniref:glutathione S-transferase family protein n=1 Tax=Arenimonas sp. TaxID=1872635 RepID=UPI0039E5799E